MQNINKGMKVFYIFFGTIQSSIIDEIEDNTFTIEGLAGCAGPHIFDFSTLGRSVFLSAEAAKCMLGNPMAELDGIC